MNPGMSAWLLMETVAVATSKSLSEIIVVNEIDRVAEGVPMPLRDAVAVIQKDVVDVAFREIDMDDERLSVGGATLDGVTEDVCRGMLEGERLKLSVNVMVGVGGGVTEWVSVLVQVTVILDVTERTLLSERVEHVAVCE